MATSGHATTLIGQALAALVAAASTFSGLAALWSFGLALPAQAGAWAGMLAAGLALGRFLGRFWPACLPLLLGGSPLALFAMRHQDAHGSHLPTVALAASWLAAGAVGAAAGVALARLRRRAGP